MYACGYHKKERKKNCFFYDIIWTQISAVNCRDIVKIWSWLFYFAAVVLSFSLLYIGPQRKENLQVLENLEADPIKQAEMKEELQKSISDEQENFSKLSPIAGISLKG